MDVGVPHFSEFRQMGQIQEVAVQFNHLIEVSTRGFNSGF
jgi:hypothetical protein